jgi:hypothetical protein
MGRILRDEAKLIFDRWLDNSAVLFVLTSSETVDLQGAFTVDKVSDGGVLLRASQGDGQLAFSLTASGTEFSYWEPREFSSDKDFSALLASLPDAERFRSCLGVKFLGRVTVPGFDDLLVPLGKLVLFASQD